ncbi:SGNH/GDSL hydrolase family protein [Streptomyces beigongshangae]|uniref:SGNH/GDSL hydrolase family protein n=1 Tax=Streptomyces beigongshangae TaxID=2841597 RepID=UPI003221A681
MTNVSCGAATIGDVTFKAQAPFGRHLPPFSTDQDHPFPAVPAQSEAVRPDTDVITVGVGGNTLGFAGILLRCMRLGADSGGVGTPCRDGLAADIPGRLAKVSQGYDQMLTLLHERAPHATVLAVGYPTIIPDDSSKCRYNDWRHFASVTRGDLTWLRKDVLEPLNEAIGKSVGTHRAARFVDLYASSRNHSVCDTDKWVEGLHTSTPDQIGLVHPDAKGHHHAADHVAAAMLNTLGTG